MKKLIALLLLIAPLPLTAQPARNPNLVLVITVDQFRYDYLTRFRSEYKEGLSLLLTKGAVFTNAQIDHFPTVTAIGHSVILTGAMPAVSGIIGNDWYEKESRSNVLSITDDSVMPLGGKTSASPRRLLVSTVGDELKIADAGASKVIGISHKDRSAVLPGGHLADAAYWFDETAGNFASSSYYFRELPAWVRKFNASRPGDRFKGAEWLGKKLPEEPLPRLYSAIAGSPFGNELLEEFVERAIEEEKLGQHSEPDLLSVSFSSNDSVGHAFGPDSPEVRDVSLQTDRVLGKLFRFLDGRIGMSNVIVVFTADHGVAPVPEVNARRNMPGGRMPANIIRGTVQKTLEQSYGAGTWVVSPSEHSLYLNRELIQAKNLNEGEVREAAARAVLSIPHVMRVYTREQLMSGGGAADDIERRVRNSFHIQRGADILVLLDPYWMFMPGGAGTTHGTGFEYDTHVPLIFLGQGIKTGRFHQRVAINDIAPTLSTILNIAVPSGSSGRILSEIFISN